MFNKSASGALCRLCPRQCGADRTRSTGFCGMTDTPVVARAALHMWEEPCISGENGSGAVFFSGCALRCVYCQNAQISSGRYGKPISLARLREIFFELAEQGAHNINLVNPTHFARPILQAMEGGMPLPVVYNTGGYDSADTLRLFEGKVDIYLPDMKYALPELGKKYSAAPDYPEKAVVAIMEMYRQVGDFVIGDDGLLKKGVVIRHLILPGNLENTFAVIDWAAKTFAPGQVLFSLMSQYTPCGDLQRFPELRRRITQGEYDAAMEHLERSGIEDGFFQELSSAAEEYIPPFDLTGV
ncbi:MAG: 4Fe-4S cluster-binding domain-containing protein [Oscillospiraceae bacterium]|nr:4Fe-4S cluster-binding domain-containing protein [Oscillospiraceae bacterium]